MCSFFDSPPQIIEQSFFLFINSEKCVIFAAMAQKPIKRDVRLNSDHQPPLPPPPMTTHAQFSASCFLSNFISGKGSEWKGGNPTLKQPPSMWSAQSYYSKKRIIFGLTDLEIPLFFFPPPPTLELQHSFQFRTKEKYISAESSPDAFSFSLFGH